MRVTSSQSMSTRATPPPGVASHFFNRSRYSLQRAVDANQQVAVYIKNRVIVIFPNKEVDVGTMNPGDHLVVRELVGPRGRDWKAFIEIGAGP